MIKLPRLPGQEENPELLPPRFPKTKVPTPFGSVYLPEHKVGLPKLPSFDEKSRAAMKHAIAIDGSMVPGVVPYIGDIIADLVEDLHFAELRKILTPDQYNEFVKQDKIAPATIAMMRALAK